MDRDTSFPTLSVHQRVQFPLPEEASDIVAVGGNLSVGMLISAYEQGVFPWYEDPSPIIWWSPRQRLVLSVGSLHVSRRMRRIIRQAEDITVTADTAFDEVITACASAGRGREEGTWITAEMQRAYIDLHEAGFAHSIEAWRGDALVGGLYGVSLGCAFFGESMFSRTPNGSKFCLQKLHELLEALEFLFIDCQVRTDHMLSLGAAEIERDRFLAMLEEALRSPSITGSWSGLLSVHTRSRR